MLLCSRTGKHARFVTLLVPFHEESPVTDLRVEASDVTTAVHIERTDGSWQFEIPAVPRGKLTVTRRDEGGTEVLRDAVGHLAEGEQIAQ